MTFFVIAAIIFYIFGAYFFLITKKHIGTSSLPVRILCFILSPMMVPSLFYEIIVDYMNGNTNERSS